ILTNSRSFTKKHTIEVHRKIVENVKEIAKKQHKDYVLISRGDSTLRGHYPIETEVMKETLEKDTDIKVDGEVIIPFFKEGGRLTINNIHYVKVGDDLIPAGETEFAKDKTFGYIESDLTKWVEEKTNKKYLSQSVITISIEDLRELNIDKIVSQLMRVTNFNKVVVNATEYADVKVFVIALIRAMNKGKYFIFRSAAALTKIIGGISDKELLTKKELVADNNNGGLIMIGSHVQKTTDQLKKLLELDNVESTEFNVNSVLNDEDLANEKQRINDFISKNILTGKSVVVYTSRKVIDVKNDKEKSLQLSVKISEAITGFVKELKTKPGFIIAKGGITSSDIGVKGLGVNKALVAGQIKPGIPVWYTGNEAKFSGMPYVIFPGNVGEIDDLRDIVYELSN
ncbi:four-carbon acid sugar kinase family protein, partial [Ligilactobacillus salivarius]